MSEVDELGEMSDVEYKLIQELVLNVGKLSTSLIQVSDSIDDVRSSVDRVWRRAED
ncbi:MAG: hypothetical protein P9L97_08900 [Candidatus Tenebribacter davisii]|nr:hypothetical protein [Candidatus Tenebribacter davisii]